jgi:hypothetical protein
MNVKGIINDAPETYKVRHECGYKFSIQSESQQQIDQTEDEL